MLKSATKASKSDKHPIGDSLYKWILVAYLLIYQPFVTFRNTLSDTLRYHQYSYRKVRYKASRRLVDEKGWSLSRNFRGRG